MRRLAAVFLLLVLVLPGAAFAQEGGLDLSLPFTVNDLGIQFDIPSDFIFEANNDGRIYFAANQDDIDAQSDDDPTTIPQGITITLRVIPVDVIVEAFPDLGETPTLDALTDLVVTQAQLTEIEDRVEIPVLARRSISAIVSDENNRTGFLTMWTQNGLLISMALAVADSDTLSQVAASWGVLIAKVRPTGALELGTNRIEMTDFTIAAPDGWFSEADRPNLVYELEDDMTADAPEGRVIILYEEALEEAELTEKSTAEDYAAFNQSYYNLTDPVRSEAFVILGQPAITLRGTEPSGQWVLLTQTILEGQAVTLAMIAANEEDLDAIEPTWIAMLQSIRPIDSGK